MVLQPLRNEPRLTHLLLHPAPPCLHPYQYEVPLLSVGRFIHGDVRRAPAPHRSFDHLLPLEVYVLPLDHPVLLCSSCRARSSPCRSSRQFERLSAYRSARGSDIRVSRPGAGAAGVTSARAAAGAGAAASARAAAWHCAGVVGSSTNHTSADGSPPPHPSTLLRHVAYHDEVLVHRMAACIEHASRRVPAPRSNS